MNIIGEVYGWLTVLEQEKRGNKTYCLCRCRCGNTKSIRMDAIRGGRTTSCGCYHRTVASKKTKNRKKNNYIDLNNGTTVIETNKGEKITIDTDDFEKVKGFCWSVANTGYAQARDLGRDSIILMHRLIMEPSPDMVVDHINHNKLDNRKANLRVCKQAYNAKNVSKPVTNTSGYVGVYWDKEKSKWNAKIGYNNKSIDLGYFNDIEEAVIARDEAEMKYFGEFGYKISMSNIEGAE